MRKLIPLPVLCGGADAALIGAAALLIPTFIGIDSRYVVLHNPDLVFGVLLPILIVVAWRGAADARFHLAGRSGWFRPAAEGFVVGFLPLPLFHGFGIAFEALAAGPPWPTPGSASLSDWLQYLAFLLIASTVSGLFGAVFAVALSATNRGLVRWLSS